MYTYTWKKYLPVIRLLMKRPGPGEQEMSLDRMDFTKGSKTRKPACSFNIDLVKGRSTTVISSAAARQLLDIMLEDEQTKALLKQNHFGISLDSDFKLRIVRHEDLQPVEQN